MPTNPSPILIDSNILIYASTPEAAFHAAALQSLERLDEEGSLQWISSQVVREYLVHMTRPDVLGTLPLLEVVEQVERLCKHFPVADDNEQVLRALCNLIRQFNVQGKKIHDAYIVATCVTFGIPRILTHNVADFQRYSSLIKVETLS